MADRRIIVYSTTSFGAETDASADADAGRRIIVYQAAPEATPDDSATWDRRIILYGDEEQDTASASADGWIV